jgi:hypothetical protein
MPAKIILLISLLFCNPVYAVKCVITGCNGELCTTPDDPAFSTCLWKAEYECYKKYGVCAANSKGECGWRQTKQLIQCIKITEQEVESTDLDSD